MADVDRRAPLGSGTVAWRRWPLALGRRCDSVQRRALGPHLAPTLAWVHVVGEQFERNFTQDGVTLGGSASCRLVRAAALACWER